MMNLIDTAIVVQLNVVIVDISYFIVSFSLAITPVTLVAVTIIADTARVQAKETLSETPALDMI